MIMLSGVNNEHASESKCTYFMAGEKRKYVNHEIYEIWNMYQSWTIIQMEAVSGKCSMK